MTAAAPLVSPDPVDRVGTRLLDSLVGYRLRRASNFFMSDFMTAMDGTLMRPTLFAMLAIVSENPGINQTRLGGAIGIQRANLVPLVNELLEKRLIDRQPSPLDRRAFALSLTEQGKALLDECIRRIRIHESRCLAVLSEGEQRQLLDLLGRIGTGASSNGTEAGSEQP